MPTVPAVPAPDVEAVMASMGAGNGDGSPEGAPIPAELASLISTSVHGSPAGAVEPTPPGQVPLDPRVNTSTNRASAMRLNRYMESAEGARFPHMQKLFQGDSADAFNLKGVFQGIFKGYEFTHRHIILYIHLGVFVCKICTYGYQIMCILIVTLYM